MKRRLLTIALILTLCLSLAVPAFAAGGFTDVDANAYYAEAVAWAVENGVTTGTSATTFSPDETCTRAQIITFLWRRTGSPAAGNGGVRDIAEGDYFYQAVCWAREKGLFDGDTFRPNDPCTRLAAVEFLWKQLGSPAAGEDRFTDVDCGAVNWAVDHGVTTGTSDTTFSPDATCTRGQIATFLYRYASFKPTVGTYLHESVPDNRFELISNGSRPEFEFFRREVGWTVSVVSGTLVSNNWNMKWGEISVDVHKDYVIVTFSGDLARDYPDMSGKYILQTD